MRKKTKKTKRKAKKKYGADKSVYKYEDNFEKKLTVRKVGRFYQGEFYPDNPKKYVGDINKIEFRSSWELRFMRMLDHDPNIIEWNSEGVIIPYYSRVDMRERRYHIDFAIKMKNGLRFLVEIKPENQIMPPKKPRRRTEKSMKNYYNACITYCVNIDKWKHAFEYAKKNGVIFVLAYQKKNRFIFIDEKKLNIPDIEENILTEDFINNATMVNILT